MRERFLICWGHDSLGFPNPFVHCVNPYRGRRPRITLAWNIDRDVIPGSPLAGLRG